MTYQTDTQGSFYLASILSFDVGTQVTLYGTIQVTTTRDFWFVLSKGDINPKLLPAGQDTSSVIAPFGMTGVSLEDFGVKGHIYKENGTTKTDFQVSAVARFTNSALGDFVLKGAIAFDNGSPRLALVSLSASPHLTLAQFVQSVIGGTWGWVGDVTDNLALLSGDIYYLKPPDNAPQDYTFPYADNDRQMTCKPGYHIDAVLQFFQSYNFQIDLSVVTAGPTSGGQSGINLQGTALQAIGSDLAKLQNLTLSISTGMGYSMSIAADVWILNTDIGHIEAGYDSTSQSFSGEIDGGLLPAPITSIAFIWTKDGGVQITSIGGFPSLLLDFINLVKAMNQLLNGGCQKILDDWFKDISTTLTVATNGSPSQDGQQLNVPLRLHYEVSAFGNSLDSGDVGFTAKLPMPHHLNELPAAIGNSILADTVGIAHDILSNPNTYKAIAEYVAVNYGKQALARLICRALDTPELSPDPDVAKDLSQTDTGNVGDTLAGAAELAAQLTRVALLDVPQIITSLVGVLGLIAELTDKLKNFFGSLAAKLGLEHQKSDAEDDRDHYHDQIASQCQQALGILQNLLTQVDGYKAAIQIQHLDLGLDQGNVYVATWRPANRNIDGVVPPAAVVCELRLLDKDNNTLWPSSADGPNPLYADQTPCTIQRQAIHSGQPVVYASVAASITNFQVMDDMSKQQIGNVLAQLDGANDDVATEWAKKLRDALQAIPNQITTNPVSTMLGMVVGSSFIGLNTRI